MAKVVHRDVGPIVAAFRKFLLGRDLNKALRFQDEVATRSPPPPILPDGPSHKLATNYYFTRDGRRESKPNEVVLRARIQPALAAGKESPSSSVKQITPGSGYVWKEKA